MTSSMSTTTPYLPTAIPTERQLRFQDWEFGLFLHFSLFTYKRLKEAERIAGFNPEALDCDQWISAAREAGMRYAVFTCKHHEGFALWPTAHSDYSVANTPWRNGKGDVVREYVEACRRHGLSVGFYYSPCDWRHPAWKKDAAAYDDFFVNQMTELLTRYGKIDMLWFDGAWSHDVTYDWGRLTRVIRGLAPDILVHGYPTFPMANPDTRWVGTEAGIAPNPCWNTVEAAPPSLAGSDAAPGRGVWLPAECDCMISGSWQYSDENEATLKSVEQLMGMYVHSVGRGCNMLLNVTPDHTGRVPEYERQRLLEFGAEIVRRFGRPLVGTDGFAREGNTWTWKPPGKENIWAQEGTLLVDAVILQEDLRRGERVRQYRINVWPEMTDQYAVEVFRGYNIGHKAICVFPQLRARKVEVEITEADGPVVLKSLALCRSR